MKKMKNILLTTVITLSILIASAVPLTSSALSVSFDDGAYTIQYSLCIGGVKITGYSGTLPSAFTVPEKLNNLTVKEIGASAFFVNQTSCGIQSVTIPGCVEKIDTFAFANCSTLNNITLNEGITNLGMGCFCYSSITNVSIPASVTDMDSAFAFCDSLTTISLPEQNSNFVIYDGAVCSSDYTKIVMYPAARSDDSFEFPDTVTEIAYAAFADAQITKIVLSPVLTAIPGYAFYNNNELLGINIPSSVTSISARAFQCQKLSSVSVFSKTVTYDGNYVFVTAASGFCMRGYDASTTDYYATNTINVPFNNFINETKTITEPMLVPAFAGLYSTGGSAVATDFSGNALSDTQYIGNGSSAKIYDKFGSYVGDVSVTLQNDLNGDGLQDSSDYTAIINQSMGISDLPGGDLFKTAADLNGDGVIDLFDASAYDLYLNQ